MHMLVSTNGVDVMASLHTQRYEKDISDIFLPCTFPYVSTDSSKMFGSFGCQKTSESRIFCVIIGDVRILNITSNPEACEPLDS
jgi:hypothetical protein